MVAHPAAVLETLDRSDLTSRITRPRGRPVAQADSDNLSVGQQCKASLRSDRSQLISTVPDRRAKRSYPVPGYPDIVWQSRPQFLEPGVDSGILIWPSMAV